MSSHLWTADSLRQEIVDAERNSGKEAVHAHLLYHWRLGKVRTEADELWVNVRYAKAGGVNDEQARNKERLQRKA